MKVVAIWMVGVLLFSVCFLGIEGNTRNLIENLSIQYHVPRRGIQDFSDGSIVMVERPIDIIPGTEYDYSVSGAYYDCSINRGLSEKFLQFQVGDASIVYGLPGDQPFGKLNAAEGQPEARGSAKSSAPKSFLYYTMDADGSNQTRLSSDSGLHFYPEWSPDGKKIAFTLVEFESFQAYVMDADGSNLLNLFISSDDSGWPAWSPDGKKIAFYAYNGGAPGLYVVDADGSNVINLIKRGTLDRDPSYSPDGKKIAFTSGNSICVMDADGNNMRKVALHGSHPAWSPDGTKIAFCSDKDGNWEIYVMSADGCNEINLTNNPAHDLVPAWSVDGTRIVFDSDRDGNKEIYVMNADGSNQINLTNNPAEDRDPNWCCHSLLIEDSLQLAKQMGTVSVFIIFVVIILAIISFRRREPPL